MCEKNPCEIDEQKYNKDFENAEAVCFRTKMQLAVKRNFSRRKELTDNLVKSSGVFWAAMESIIPEVEKNE